MGDEIAFLMVKTCYKRKYWPLLINKIKPPRMYGAVLFYKDISKLTIVLVFAEGSKV